MGRPSAFSSSFVSYSLAWAAQVAMTIFLQVYLYSRGLSVVQVGVIGGLNGGALAAFQIEAGGIADKIAGKRNYLVLVSVIGRGFLILAMAYLYSFPLECVWATLYGTATAPFLPTTMAMVSDEGKGEETGKNMGKFRMAGSIGWTVGNLAFGWIALISIKLAFIMAAALNFSAALPMVLHQDKPKLPKRAEKAHKKNLTRAFAYFLASVFLISLTTGAGNQFLPVYLHEIGASTFIVGAVIASGSAAEIPFMYLGGGLSDRIGDKVMMISGSIIFSIIYLLYSVISVPTPFLFVQAGRGAAYAFYHSSSMAFTQRGDEAKRGTYAGWFNSSANAGIMAGSFAGGFIASAVGFKGLFLALSITALCSISLLMIMESRSQGLFHVVSRPTQGMILVRPA
ncbi:MAG: MFS transporter [Thermoprotei archaeon]